MSSGKRDNWSRWISDIVLVWVLFVNAAYYGNRLSVYATRMLAWLGLKTINKLEYVAGRVPSASLLERNLPLYSSLSTLPITRYIDELLPSDSLVTAMYAGVGYYVESIFFDTPILDGHFRGPPPLDPESFVGL